ncbi:MAG: hypothetical protein ACRDNM_07220, partial [Gaiellaceae bacterium]
MARRSSYRSRLAQMQREAERQARARELAVAAAVREAERTRKALERAQASEEKERKRLYAESRQAETDAMNTELEAEVEELQTLLQATLSVDDYLDFDLLKEDAEIPPFQPGVLDVVESPPSHIAYMPPEPTGVGKFLPGAKAKHEATIAEGQKRFDEALGEHAKREAERTEA